MPMAREGTDVTRNVVAAFTDSAACEAIAIKPMPMPAKTRNRITRTPCVVKGKKIWFVDDESIAMATIKLRTIAAMPRPNRRLICKSSDNAR